MKASIISVVLSTAGLAIGGPTKDAKKRASSFQCMSMSTRPYLSERFKSSMTDICCSLGFGSNESGAEFGSGNIPGVEVCKFTSSWAI
jgi:hypothetical protein